MKNMKYTKDNIVGVVYRICSNWIILRVEGNKVLTNQADENGVPTNSEPFYDLAGLDTVLECLNNGSWRIVFEESNNQVYKIY